MDIVVHQVAIHDIEVRELATVMLLKLPLLQEIGLTPVLVLRLFEIRLFITVRPRTGPPDLGKIDTGKKHIVLATGGQIDLHPLHTVVFTDEAVSVPTHHGEGNHAMTLLKIHAGKILASVVLSSGAGENERMVKLEVVTE
jgi:hypothetical protein